MVSYTGINDRALLISSGRGLPQDTLRRGNRERPRNSERCTRTFAMAKEPLPATCLRSFDPTIRHGRPARLFLSLGLDRRRSLPALNRHHSRGLELVPKCKNRTLLQFCPQELTQGLRRELRRARNSRRLTSRTRPNCAPSWYRLREDNSGLVRRRLQGALSKSIWGYGVKMSSAVATTARTIKSR
jgi:hypothetical protein